MRLEETLSYDDVLLLPSYSEVQAGDVSVETVLTPSIKLNIPVISAAMDTVTEDDLAIALALEGGAGIIHRNMSPENQAAQVGRVKRYLNWVIESPITVEKSKNLAYVRQLMEQNRVSGLPVIDENNKLCGIITGRDLRFCTDDTLIVKDVMTEKPVVEKGEPNLESAQEKFNSYKIEKLPVVSRDGTLKGLITVKDLEKHQKYPHAAVDERGRLVVGAAVSPMDFTKRIPLLLESKVDFVVIDTAHGDSKSVVDSLKEMKRLFNLPVIAGNVATAEGTRRLIGEGADAVKVGVGPGSICTTRVVAGIGVPQMSAVLWCAEEAEKQNIPVIADGGIKFFRRYHQGNCSRCVHCNDRESFRRFERSAGQGNYCRRKNV